MKIVLSLGIGLQMDVVFVSVLKTSIATCDVSFNRHVNKAHKCQHSGVETKCEVLQLQLLECQY